MEKTSRASQQAKIRKIRWTEEQEGSVEWLHWPGWPMEAEIWQPHLRGRGIGPLHRHGGPLQAVARLRPQVKNFVDPAMFSFVPFSDESKIVTVWFPLWRAAVFGTIPILLQQRDWVDEVRKRAIFADVQYYLHRLGGWVRKRPKMCWHDIRMVPFESARQRGNQMITT